MDALISGLPSAAVVTAFCIAALLWLRDRAKAYLDQYLSEKGKNLARSEDIDKLAREVEVLTEKAETIKANLAQQGETLKQQLSHEYWDK